jgi:N-methylhydantoinase B
MPSLTQQVARRLDPITLEVLRHGLQEIAEEMAVALMRAAYSTNITDRRDCSCAVYLPRAEPVAQSESGTPLHLGVMPAVVRSVLRLFPANSMQPGDQYMMNTPYPEGPGHLNDLTLLAPVFLGSHLVAIVANQAHHIDIGGMVPGSMPADAVEVFQEGLQIPPIALIRCGRIVEDTLALFLANVRTPATTRGDLMAQAAANKVGTDRLQALVQRWGVDLVEAAMEELLDHAERRIRAAIATLPSGVYRASDFLEGPRGGTLGIHVSVTIAGDELSADFSGTHPQVAAPLNCRPPTLLACLAYVVQAMLDPGQSPNAGALRPLQVKAPEGSLLNARYPASVVHSNVVTTQRICDVLLRALHAAAPNRVIAACAGTQVLICLGGHDLVRGEPFTYIETHGGGAGAGLARDGQSGVHTHMTNTLNSPAEVLEQTFPIQMLEYGLEPDTAGAGCWRGGFGMRKSLQIKVPATLTIAADRIHTRPWGLEGGRAAAPARVELRRNGRRRRLGARATIRLEPGDILTLVTPGGGGWGNPRKRDRQAVAADVEGGLVSPAAAKRLYGDDDTGARR